MNYKDDDGMKLFAIFLMVFTALMVLAIRFSGIV